MIIFSVLGAGPIKSAEYAVITTTLFPTFYFGAIGYLDPVLIALTLSALINGARIMRRHQH